MNSFGPSAATIPITFSTTASVPEKVSGVQVHHTPCKRSRCSDNVTLTWVKGEDNGAALTELRVWSTDVDSGDVRKHNVPTDAVHTRLKGLRPGRSFSFEMEAVNALGSSGRTSAAGVFMMSGVPKKSAAPYRAPSLDTSFLGCVDPATTLHVMWTTPESSGLAVTQFELELTTPGGRKLRLPRARLFEDPQEYLFTGLEQTSAYGVRVRATNVLSLIHI